MFDELLVLFVPNSVKISIMYPCQLVDVVKTSD